MLIKADHQLEESECHHPDMFRFHQLEYELNMFLQVQLKDVLLIATRDLVLQVTAMTKEL